MIVKTYIYCSLFREIYKHTKDKNDDKHKLDLKKAEMLKFDWFFNVLLRSTDGAQRDRDIPGEGVGGPSA